MAQHIHLQNGLFGGHHLHKEVLHPGHLDLLVGLVVKGVGEIDLRADFLGTLQAGLVPADLPAQGRDDVIQGLVHLQGGFLCPVDHAPLLDGDLYSLTVPLHRYGNGGLGILVENTV